MTTALFHALAVAAFAATNAPPAGNDPYGVVTAVQFLQNSKDTQGLKKLGELGVGWVRTGIDWDVVQHKQPTPGADTFDFAFTDEMIKNAHGKGIKIFASLGNPPLWAAPCSACMPKDLKAWSRYVRRVVERYAWLGDDITFGIWNEPNDTYFLSESGEAFRKNSHARAEPELYARLFNAAAKARDESDNPGARMGALEATDAVFNPEPWWKLWKSGTWFEEAWPLISKQLKPQDFVTLHYYPPKGWKEADLYAFMATADAGTNGRETWITESPGDDIPRLALAFADRPAKRAHWKKFFVYRIWGGEDDRFSLLNEDWTSRKSFNAYRDFIKARSGKSKNGAVVVAVRPPPAEMAPGAHATVSVTVRNTGQSAWTAASGHKLGAQDPADNAFWRVGRVPLAAGATVKPGEEHVFTWTIAAPTKAGTYPFQWRMVQEKVEWFGRPSAASRVVVR